MFQLDEKIKVFTTLTSFDKATFAKTFNVDEANIDIEKIDNNVEKLEKPAWFVKENLRDGMHFDLSSLSAKDEYFFYYPKITDGNLFFNHSELSNLDESFEFTGVSYSKSFQPSSSDFKPCVLSYSDGEPVLFLDRDGILNVDKGYVGNSKTVEVLDDLADVIRACNDKKVKVVVLTNQSGVSRGYFSITDVDSVNNYISEVYKRKNALIDKFYLCPFHSDGHPPYKKESILRKPLPGMAVKACEEFRINFNRSLMVGDKVSDILQYCNLKSLIVESNYHNYEYAVGRGILKKRLFEWLSEI